MMGLGPTKMQSLGTDDGLAEEVIAALRGSMLGLRGFPEMQCIERPGWAQLITPTFKQGGLNEVSLAVMTQEEAESRIDGVLTTYKDLGLKFRWVVTPGSQPEDLGERLARRGLARQYLQGMVRSTANATSQLAARIEKVGPTTVSEYTSVVAQGWEVDPEPLDRYHRALLSDPSGKYRLFLVWSDGKPAGAGSYIASERSAYLQGAVILPPFRRHGLYRELVNARMRCAAAHGLQVATTLARELTSAPVLERMGFRTVCRFPVFSN